MVDLKTSKQPWKSAVNFSVCLTFRDMSNEVSGRLVVKVNGFADYRSAENYTKGVNWIISADRMGELSLKHPLSENSVAPDALEIIGGDLKEFKKLASHPNTQRRLALTTETIQLEASAASQSVSKETETSGRDLGADDARQDKSMWSSVW